MFESILSIVKYLSRENHYNGNPEWINGKTVLSVAFEFYFMQRLCSHILPQNTSQMQS